MTLRTCETCIHSAPRTFAGREELRCFRTSRNKAGIGWSITAETHKDNIMALAHRCGPDRDWWEAKT